MKNVLVILAPGFEEVEALTVVDILRRAGANVTMAGTVDGEIIGRNKIRVLADKSINDTLHNDFDIIVLPGGMQGTENLNRDKRVKTLLKNQDSKGKLIGAICAAPTVIFDMGLTAGKNITSHPSVRREFTKENYSEARVVVDGNIITSRSPGTAMEFAFEIVEILYSQNRVEEVNKGVLAKLSH